MSEEIKKKYFGYHELARLNSLEGKKISEVNYYVWVNRINMNSPYVFIDKLELVTDENEKLVLTGGEESDGLYLLSEYDPAEEILRLEHQFAGQITVKKHKASQDRFWKDVMNLEIQSVQLSKEGDRYLADAIVLDFGQERRLIGLSPEEGIIIDFYEED